MYDVSEKVVRAFISHQFGLGSNPDVDIKCGLILLLVLSLATLLKKQQSISNNYSNSIWNTRIHLKNELLRTRKCFVGKQYYYNSYNYCAACVHFIIIHHSTLSCFGCVV